MIGIAGKNFLKYHDILLDKLRVIDSECYKLSKPLCVRLHFWCKVTWTKNKIPFSDELLNRLQWNLHEIQFLYHKFISKYGGGNNQRFGIKIHGFYHIWEFIQHRKFSPAEMDDERIEAWNAYIARFAPIFECFGGKVNLVKMIEKLWREFTMTWDINNNNYVWDGKDLI